MIIISLVIIFYIFELSQVIFILGLFYNTYRRKNAPITLYLEMTLFELYLCKASSHKDSDGNFY
jgi:hypothetical protein